MYFNFEYILPLVVFQEFQCPNSRVAEWLDTPPNNRCFSRSCSCEQLAIAFLG
jgi:hypothetical protein